MYLRVVGWLVVFGDGKRINWGERRKRRRKEKSHPISSPRKKSGREREREGQRSLYKYRKVTYILR